MARRGVRVSAAEIAEARSPEDFVALVERALERRHAEA
jgi:hypothetical protein